MEIITPRNYIQRDDGTFKPVRRRRILILRDAQTHAILREIEGVEWWNHLDLEDGPMVEYRDAIWIYEEI